MAALRNMCARLLALRVRYAAMDADGHGVRGAGRQMRTCPAKFERPGGSDKTRQ
jgi:hypothetical protein